MTFVSKEKAGLVLENKFKKFRRQLDFIEQKYLSKNNHTFDELFDVTLQKQFLEAIFLY